MCPGSWDEQDRNVPAGTASLHLSCNELLHVHYTYLCVCCVMIYSLLPLPLITAMHLFPTYYYVYNPCAVLNPFLMFYVNLLSKGFSSCFIRNKKNFVLLYKVRFLVPWIAFKPSNSPEKARSPAMAKALLGKPERRNYVAHRHRTLQSKAPSAPQAPCRDEPLPDLRYAHKVVG